MGMKPSRILSALAAVLLFAVTATAADQRPPVRPNMKDKCPVCGMFAAKYPDFLAQVIFQDGSYAVFDGPKDLFKYFFNIKRYNPAQGTDAIAAVYVTDYYTLKPIDGLRAYYVSGSDVYGPMGNELIPFASESDAKEFMKDHRGKSVLKFGDIKIETVKKLDER